VSATYDEDANGNGVLDAGEDTNGNGVLDRGSDVNFTAGATNIKGNFFGNAYVWLRIAPSTAGGAVDIRAGTMSLLRWIQPLQELPVMV